MEAGEIDDGIARAGAAVAARRRELGISQRELARQKIITAPALITFEKGRSWPRERTRHTLEQLLQWPAGTIARIRAGAELTRLDRGPQGALAMVTTTVEIEGVAKPACVSDSLFLLRPGKDAS